MLEKKDNKDTKKFKQKWVLEFTNAKMDIVNKEKPTIKFNSPSFPNDDKKVVVVNLKANTFITKVNENTFRVPQDQIINIVGLMEGVIANKWIRQEIKESEYKLVGAKFITLSKAIEDAKVKNEAIEQAQEEAQEAEVAEDVESTKIEDEKVENNTTEEKEEIEEVSSM